MCVLVSAISSEEAPLVTGGWTDRAVTAPALTIVPDKEHWTTSESNQDTTVWGHETERNDSSNISLEYTAYVHINQILLFVICREYSIHSTITFLLAGVFTEVFYCNVVLLGGWTY